MLKKITYEVESAKGVISNLLFTDTKSAEIDVWIDVNWNNRPKITGFKNAHNSKFIIKMAPNFFDPESVKNIPIIIKGASVKDHLIEITLLPTVGSIISFFISLIFLVTVFFSKNHNNQLLVISIVTIFVLIPFIRLAWDTIRMEKICDRLIATAEGKLKK